MLAFRKNKRFSLLTLEEGEVYIDDFACSYTLIPTVDTSATTIMIEGRLRLLSGAFVFEPDDIKYPVVRISMEKIDFIQCDGEFKSSIRSLIQRSTGINNISNCIYLQTQHFSEFKKHNRNDPYKFRKGQADILFQFKYAQGRDIMKKILPVATLWIGPETKGKDGLIRVERPTVEIQKITKNTNNNAKNTISSVSSSVGSWFDFGRKRSTSNSVTSSTPQPISNSFALNAPNKSKILDELQDRFENSMRSSPFDLSWIGDFREEIKCEVISYKITPLVDQAGRLLLTQKRLYFQPFHKVSSKPVRRYDLDQIYCIVKRRRLLRHIGIEIFMKNDKSLFFTFENTNLRNRVYDELTKLGAKRLKSSMSDMTVQWQAGNVSNFDYLLYLNFMADRTFNDISQYPVFPWIIKDYISEELNLNSPDTYRDLSKPMGAMNPVTVKSLWKRYQEMPHPKFLYGTHYSSEAYVLYYLVREIPEYMLRLQNGSFDAPDRMFHSISDTWNSIMENPSDVKELLPEFFHSSSNFLKNNETLNLGTKQNNQKVNHVILPKWANGDPKKFIYLNRLALESEYVSEHLHNWIDLIFGYKQTGKEAEEAHNVFHYLSYEGSVDLESIRDPLEKKAIESQIKSFGQTPKQLFKYPHPKRIVTKPKNLPTLYQVTSSDKIPLDPILNVFSSLSNDQTTPLQTVPSISSDWFSKDNSNYNYKNSQIFNKNENSQLIYSESPVSLLHQIEKPELQQRGSIILNQELPGNDINIENLEIILRESIHRDSINSCITNQDGTILYTASHDASAKLFSLLSKRQMRRLTGMGDMAISSCLLLENSKEDSLILSSFNNNIYVYSISFGRIVETIPAHDDAVCQLRQFGNTLISGGWDCTIKIWKNEKGSISKTPQWELSEHDSEVNCVNIDRVTGDFACSGSMDGEIIVYDLKSGRSFYDYIAHRGSSIQDCWFVPGDCTQVLTCGKDGLIKVIQVNAGEIKCIENSHLEGCYTRMEILDDNHFIVGADNGVLYAFRFNDYALVSKKKIFECPITSIYTSIDKIILGSENGEICLLKKTSN